MLVIRKGWGKMLNLDLTQFESTFVIEIVEVEHFASFPDCAGQVIVATAETWKPRIQGYREQRITFKETEDRIT